jgi:hypothetical protein
MINFGGDRFKSCFGGAGTGGDIHTIEVEFDKGGMPEKGKPAFCNFVIL